MSILSIAYFPPLSYFSLLLRGDVLLEGWENYQKQSWRNRCNILGANGVEALQVPVIHSGGTFKHPIGEIMVDYSRNWLIRQKRAIDSAYLSSAYFEHYRDGLYAVLDRRPERLWDLDLSIINFFLELCGRPAAGCADRDTGLVPVDITEKYRGVDTDIHPKHPDTVYQALSSSQATLGQEYFQVFSPKFGFVPNLSILDYISNEGTLNLKGTKGRPKAL